MGLFYFFRTNFDACLVRIYCNTVINICKQDKRCTVLSEVMGDFYVYQRVLNDSCSLLDQKLKRPLAPIVNYSTILAL